MLHCSLSNRYRTALLRVMFCSRLRARFCRKYWDESIGSVITIARSLRRRPGGSFGELSHTFSTYASVGFKNEGELNYKRSSTAKVCAPAMTSRAKCLSNRITPNFATAKSILRRPFRASFDGSLNKNFDTQQLCEQSKYYGNGTQSELPIAVFFIDSRLVRLKYFISFTKCYANIYN